MSVNLPLLHNHGNLKITLAYNQIRILVSLIGTLNPVELRLGQWVRQSRDNLKLDRSS